MKKEVIIHYDLTDEWEENEYILSSTGKDAYMALWDFEQYLRNLDKHSCDDFTDNEALLVERIREKFYECLEDNELNLYNLR